MIYAIRAVGTNFVKFGKARDVVKRLSCHQISSPFDLRLVASAPWPDSEESMIHLYLSDCRERGEWFNSSSSVERVIGLLRDGELGLREWLRVRQAGVGVDARSTLRRIVRLRAGLNGQPIH